VNDEFDDCMFDVAAVEAGAWSPGPYGPGDQLGSFNEVTPEKTTAALSLLDLTRPVGLYQLGETLRNGFPAIQDRRYEQVLRITGYQPPAGFAGICASAEPSGNNRISTHEERVSLTYNMGTKINGLTHVGVGEMFYNGFRGSDITETWGTARLGAETVPPIVTRGVLVDVVGWKVATGDTRQVFEVPNGRPVLESNYRITVEDIESTLAWEEVSKPIGPGDVVLLRTGWRELIEVDPVRYISALPPGPFLREVRYLAARRPAIVGIDVWCFGLIDPEIDGGNPCCCHQELFVKHGIRIGEAVPSDGLAADGVYEFVFTLSPTKALGAVGLNSPPLALGQPAG
jgi:kynurenine formamidase